MKIKKSLIILVILLAIIVVFKYVVFQIWWLFVLPVFLVGVFNKSTMRFSFLIGLVAGGLAYAVLLFMLTNETQDLTRVSQIVAGPVWLAKLAVCVPGAVLTGLAFHAGNHLNLRKSQDLLKNKENVSQT